MQAPANLSQKSYRFQNGVRIVSGYGASIRVDRGHLVISDRGMAGQGESRLERIGHGLRRLVVISPDWYITGAALEWLTHADASLVVLERDGPIFMATGRQGTSEAKLRRAQACLPDAIALRIAKQLVDRKLEGQERNARELLGNKVAADAIAAYRLALYRKANTPSRLRGLESRAAAIYWSAFEHQPVTWDRADLPKIPVRWLEWGTRHSPLTSPSPRLSVTPAHSCLNYLLSILEAEARIALTALGLDSKLGVFHVDRGYRDSLCFDLSEPVRPQVERWLWQFLREPQERRMYFERQDGCVRLMAEMCRRLAETATLWQRAVAPVAEWVTEEIWKTIPAGQVRKPSTRLTQSARRDAKQAAG
jgi:CRISPR-associated endonuclease Cas1